MKFKDFISDKEFAQKRYDGAKKIAQQAKQKGGTSMLSYQHFAAKLPKYRKAITDLNNKHDPKWLKTEFNRLKSQLNIDKLTQKQFQELTGKLETVGELYIKIKE